MKCPHGTPDGDTCPGCSGGLARVCPECSRYGGRCWRHTNTTVVVPPYTFRPFEPIDSTVSPTVISLDGGIERVGVLPGLSWAPPPAVRALALAVEAKVPGAQYTCSTSSFTRGLS